MKISTWLLYLLWCVSFPVTVWAGRQFYAHRQSVKKLIKKGDELDAKLDLYRSELLAAVKLLKEKE